MAEPTIRYYFGRLNIIAVYDDKRQFLLTSLRADVVVATKTYNWGFFNIEEIETPDRSFVHGFLVKYAPEGEEEIVVPESRQINDEAIKNRLNAKSRFFLHIPSGLIAYHPVGGRIEQHQFRKHFAQLITEANEGFFTSAEIQSVDDEYVFMDLVRQFQTIQKVRVFLVPSNPSNRDVWERTDDRLKRLNAATYEEEIVAHPKSDGLNVWEDTELTSKFVMAQDGYGEATVTGKIDGENKTVSTKENPITTQAPNDDKEPDKVLAILKFTFDKIFQRFTNGH
jgi:hypothetical protein